MSPRQNDVQVLENAIIAKVQEETDQILAEAQAQVDNIRRQAQEQADAEREAILQRAQEEAQASQSHRLATAQMAAQTLQLERREQLLGRVFTEARQRLTAVLQEPDYGQIVRRLVCEAIMRLSATELLVLADAGTRKVLDDALLADLEKELGVQLRFGGLLAQGTGIIVQTTDGHRRYDNTLETRLARMRDTLRAPVYHLLRGETL
ncbi:MAG: hypothetical protein J7M17_03625 [Anaerolineae bacterium]|nr:hypothetical protein [Anaerolineae bacterium]